MKSWEWFVVKLTDLNEDLLVTAKQTGIETLRTAKPGFFSPTYALVAYPKYRAPLQIRANYTSVNIEEELSKPEWNV